MYMECKAVALYADAIVVLTITKKSAIVPTTVKKRMTAFISSSGHGRHTFRADREYPLSQAWHMFPT